MRRYRSWTASFSSRSAAQPDDRSGVRSISVRHQRRKLAGPLRACRRTGMHAPVLALYPVHILAITVLERTRGYSLLWRGAREDDRARIETARVAYMKNLGRVWPLDAAVALVAGEIIAMLPEPPTPPRRSHRLVESRQERLARWRFDGMIAATALVAKTTLIHNNASDFESIRSGIERSPERFPALGPLELIRCTSLI